MTLEQYKMTQLNPRLQKQMDYENALATIRSSKLPSDSKERLLDVLHSTTRGAGHVNRVYYEIDDDGKVRPTGMKEALLF